MSSEIVAINTLADNSRFTGAGYQDALITDCLLRQEYAGVKRGLVKSSSAPIGEAARLRRRGQSQSVGGANSKAFLSFLAAAKLGDEEAQVSVGYDYAYGITGKVNVDEALRWWKRLQTGLLGCCIQSWDVLSRRETVGKGFEVVRARRSSWR
jgi:hypothetical protein